MKATQLPNPRWENRHTIGIPSYVGAQRLFKLEPPLPWHAYGDQDAPLEHLEYILVSDSNVPNPFTEENIPETMTFRSNERGEYLNGENLSVVNRRFDHIDALKQLGVTEIVELP